MRDVSKIDDEEQYIKIYMKLEGESSMSQDTMNI